MKTKNKTIIEKSLFSFVFLLALTSFVSAFAISSTYYNGNPLKLSAGDSANVGLTLQNMVGGEDVIAKLSILKGAEIMKSTDSSDTYTVLFGEKVGANFLVTIPEDAEVGSVYPIEVEFKTTIDSGSGEFKFGSGVSQKFEVLVVTKEPVKAETPTIGRDALQNNSYGIWIILIVLVFVIAMIYYYFTKKKNKNNKKKFKKK
ncbi:MAG: hypothetical protein ACP5OG_02710 [Candidatus Nanoarchaeia archaeon]